MASHVQYVRKEVDKNYYDADNSHFQCCTRKPLLLHSGHSPLPSPPPRHSWCHGGLAHQHCSLEWGCCRDVQSRSWLLNPVRSELFSNKLPCKLCTDSHSLQTGLDENAPNLKWKKYTNIHTFVNNSTSS